MTETNITDKRTLFIDNKVEVLTLPELKRTINAEDIGGLQRTKPVPHFKMIEDLTSILKDAGQAPQIDHISILVVVQEQNSLNK